MRDEMINKFQEFLGLKEKEKEDIGLVLSGGGARAAYQAGVLDYISDAFPDTHFSIMKGVSAGAINTGYLANHTGSFRDATQLMVESWQDLSLDHVFQTESTFDFFRRLMKNKDGDSYEERITSSMAHQRGLLDPAPLRQYLADKFRTDKAGNLTGVQENIDTGKLKAFAVTTTNYMTGQTTTFVQGCNIEQWVRPSRVGVRTQLTVDHILASAALPVLFPAVMIDGSWHGDGGVRLTNPLSPAITMGADRILVISTRYKRTQAEADVPTIKGYPPAAQIIGILMNAIFLDAIDQDAENLERVNELLRQIPERSRNGLRPIKLLMIRPSVDIGKLAGKYKPQFSGALRLFTMSIGSDETKSPDWLSMLLFQKEYMKDLIDVGYNDAAHQHDEIEAFLEEADQVGQKKNSTMG
ncbi:MAG: patatin-like phospholipase family protein [Rhodothermales bacterium]